jgi:UDP-N-acetylglucosamine--N-acetylmuramyl-(pentapeptide) pyrophosphoryl-undecaprenol N-acetylglucosamine transferase
MRFVLAGGGTGGHVYPALSVAEYLKRAAPETELLYIGTRSGAEQRLVPPSGIPFRSVHAGQVRGKAPWQTAASVVRLGRGVIEARAGIAAFRPDAVFATGGYASVPVLLAARLAGIPLTVFLPDVYPGWAVRLAARLATRVATSTQGALAFLPREKAQVTGYPLRPEFWSLRREEARRRLGLGTGTVLLVSGASTGSRSLNDGVMAALPGLLDITEVLHLTGAADLRRVAEARAALPLSQQARYHVLGYLEEMPLAMIAADLALMRAGASCLAEPPAAGLPAILVPGPFSDQRRNADYMAAEGAAIVLDQGRLQQLLDLIRSLVANTDRLGAMAAAARRLARPDAARSLASMLLTAGDAKRLPQERVS